MAIAPASLVVGAPRVPVPGGLFSTFTFRPATADRWEAGVRWETDTCDPVQGFGDPACPPDPTLGLPKQLDPNLGSVGEATPFGVYGHWSCSPVGFDPASAQAKATAHLQAREEARVEQALWTGDLGNVPNLTGANGSPPPQTLAGGTAMPPSGGLAILEDYIAGTYGGMGVIHMSRGAALQAAGPGFLEARGGRLFTRIGTPVVSGAGYPGTGPNNAAAGEGESWAYASPPLFGYRGDVLTSSSRPGDLFDPRHNVLTAIAERLYLLGFDPCGLAAVLLNLAT